MTLPVPLIRVYFGAEYGGGDFFVLDDPVKGVLDNTTYLIAGDDGNGVEIQTDAFNVTIRRGRSRELDEFEAGTCTVALHNFDRTYDALNTAGVYYGDLVPGKRVEIDLWGQRVFAGIIEDWTIDLPINAGEAVATFTAEDALSQLARKEFDAWTTTAGQTAGPRIAASLDRSEVAFGYNRDLGTGVSTLQADSVTWGSNALNYLQLVAKSDAGRLFASRFNLLTYQDRHHLVSTSTPTVAFGTGGIPFHGTTTVVGSELLFNRVGVDRGGGTLQTIENTASQGAYGVRTLSMPGLLMDSDIQSQSMAEYLCYLYKDPTARLASITVKVHALSASQRSAVAGIEIGDLASVTLTPFGVGPAISESLVVEGVDHDISLQEHYATISFGLQTQASVFILDDPVYGALDTGPGMLSF